MPFTQILTQMVNRRDLAGNAKEEEDTASADQGKYILLIKDLVIIRVFEYWNVNFSKMNICVIVH